MPSRIIHTHPIKKTTEIADALAAGVRTFVIDNAVELGKFADAPADTRLLIRLAYRSPHAKSDLSTKFGRRRRSRRHGWRRRRGMPASASPASASMSAVSSTTRTLREPRRPRRLDLMELLERRRGSALRHDRHRRRIPRRLRRRRDAPRGHRGGDPPILETRAAHLEVIAEPGRILVGESMTLVTSVVGLAERGDGRWCYLDDGVYGSYSNVLAEDVHPLVFAVRELDGSRSGPAPLDDPRRADMRQRRRRRARELLLPELAVGDLLVSPAMGAYTAVTATGFNGRPMTPIVVLNGAPATGRIDDGRARTRRVRGVRRAGRARVRPCRRAGRPRRRGPGRCSPSR